jgi:hypothetical protein
MRILARSAQGARARARRTVLVLVLAGPIIDPLCCLV